MRAKHLVEMTHKHYFWKDKQKHTLNTNRKKGVFFMCQKINIIKSKKSVRVSDTFKISTTKLIKKLS